MVTDSFLHQAENSRSFELQAAGEKWQKLSEALGIAGLDKEAWKLATNEDMETGEHQPVGVYLVEVQTKTHEGKTVQVTDGQEAKESFVLLQVEQKTPNPLDEIMFPSVVSTGVAISEKIADKHLADADIRKTGLTTRVFSLNDPGVNYESKTVTIPVIKDGKDSADFRRVKVNRFKNDFKEASVSPFKGKRQSGNGMIEVTVQPLWTKAMDNLFDPEAGKLSDSRLKTAAKYLEEMKIAQNDQSFVQAMNTAATILSRCKPQ